MSPVRAYRCSAGHEFEVREGMEDEPVKGCPKAWSITEDVHEECGAPCERIISKPARAQVRSGTPTFHGKID